MKTEIEYRQLLSDLEKEFEQKKRDLILSVGKENEAYKIGDIITDHIGSLEIKRIQYTVAYGSRMPVSVYSGIELKKDLKPCKKQDGRRVYGNNIINQKP